MSNVPASATAFLTASDEELKTFIGATYSGSGFAFLENAKTVRDTSRTTSIEAVGKQLSSAGVPAASAWVYENPLPNYYKAGAILLRPV